MKRNLSIEKPFKEDDNTRMLGFTPEPNKSAIASLDISEPREDSDIISGRDYLERKCQDGCPNNSCSAKIKIESVYAGPPGRLDFNNIRFSITGGTINCLDTGCPFDEPTAGDRAEVNSGGPLPSLEVRQDLPA